MNVSAQVRIDAADRLLRLAPEQGFIEWAESNVRLPDGSPFRLYPYQRAIAEDMFADGVAELYLRLFSGFGKTFVLGAGFGYAIEQHAAKCGAMFPAEEDGKRWLEEELKPVLGKYRPVDGKERFHIGEFRAIRDVAGLLRFANGGRMEIIGQAFNKIRRAQLDVTLADEIDAMDKSKGSEGDRVKAFFGRTRQMRMQRHWGASYPSVIGQSRIDDAVAASQSLWWIWTCPACKGLWKPHRRNLAWEMNASGDIARAWIVCPACEERYNDAQRREISAKGAWMVEGEGSDEWLPDDPENRRIYRAYSSGCMIQLGRHDPNYPDYIVEIASRTVAVDGSRNRSSSLRVLANQLDAESYLESAAEKPEPSTLVARREVYDPEIEIPAGVLSICAGADPNQRFTAIEIVGYGLNDESWGLGYIEVAGHVLRSSTWQKIEEVLSRTFRHPAGYNLPISLTCIDSRYQSKTVRAWCADRGRKGVVPIVGSNNLGAPFVGGKTKCKYTRISFFKVGTNEGKDRIYQQLELSPATNAFPQGYMHYPAIEAYGEEYFRGLTAEDMSMKKSQFDGHLYPAYEKRRDGDRNEPLDVRNYANFAVAILKPNFPALAKKLRVPDGASPPKDDAEPKRKPNESPPRQKQPTAPVKPPQRRRKRGRGSFVMGR